MSTEGTETETADHRESAGVRASTLDLAVGLGFVAVCAFAIWTTVATGWSGDVMIGPGLALAAAVYFGTAGFAPLLVGLRWSEVQPPGTHPYRLARLCSFLIVGSPASALVDPTLAMVLDAIAGGITALTGASIGFYGMESSITRYRRVYFHR